MEVRETCLEIGGQHVEVKGDFVLRLGANV